MIPALGRYVAIVKSSAGHQVRLPVVAWSDDGEALVVDYRSGRLRPASDHNGFDSIDREDPVAAVIPGGGWRFAWKEEDGSETLTPVLAWVVDADGWAKPVDVDVEALSAEPVSLSNATGVRLVAPAVTS